MATKKSDSHFADVETETTFYERVELAMDHEGSPIKGLNGKQRFVALEMATGVKPDSLRQLKYSGGHAHAVVCEAIASFLRIDLSWLISGKGEMKPLQGTWPFDEVTPVQWNSIPPATRAVLQDIVRLFANRYTKSRTK